MKYIYLFGICLIFFSTALNGQERYLDEVFCEVEVLNDLEYCSQISFALTALGFDTSMAQFPLFMDLYLPVDDDLTERPLVIYVHTGNFLDSESNALNGGTKQDSCVVEICTQLAKRGFVTASIGYRLGWNPLAPTQEERTKSGIRAWYRALQDTRTANRFFRRDYEMGNQYGIDTSRMIVWGQGTGSLVATGAASFDDFNELDLPQFYLTTITGAVVPMIDENVDGDIYGTSAGIDSNGIYITLPRYAGYSSDFDLAVHLGGSVIDTSFIDENTLPIISFGIPESGYTGNGSYGIQQKLAEFGINDAFDVAGFTDPYTLQALSTTGQTVITPSDTIPVNNDFAGLYPFLVDDPDNIEPWAWFDSLTNAMSPFPIVKENSLLYIDTIMNYFAPRAINALDMSGTQVNGLEGIPTEVEFLWDTLTSDTAAVTLTIVNPSATDFQIIPNSDIVNFGTNAPDSIEACGGSVEFEVYFHPNMAAEFSDSLVFLSTNGSQIVIPIVGEVEVEVGDTIVPGLEELKPELITVYPNPSNGFVQIDLTALETNHALIRIYDNTGKKLIEERVGTSIFQLEGLSSGIYMVNLETPLGLINKKIVIL